MLRRNGRICLKRRPCSALPMKTIGPSDEMSRRSAKPSVVLPEPDSPTTPSVSPLRRSTLTPSTALIWPTTVRMRRRLVGLRLGGEKRARVGMLRCGERALDGALFDDLAFLHHADLLRDLAN